MPSVSGSLPPYISAQLLTYFFEELDDFSIITMIFSQTKLDFRKIFEKINIFWRNAPNTLLFSLNKIKFRKLAERFVVFFC